jgi:hypothetical protein
MHYSINKKSVSHTAPNRLSGSRLAASPPRRLASLPSWQAHKNSVIIKKEVPLLSIFTAIIPANK